MSQEVQEEQDFLDRAHEGLDAMRSDAASMLASVLDVGRGGTFQSRTERDIVVRTTMARLAQLDLGDQALCFGRIDRVPDGPGEPGESFHIGRLAVSSRDHEPLVVDWRAPVAAPFYRATGLDPQGLARRRHLAVRGRTVVGVEDEYFGGPPVPPNDTAGVGLGLLASQKEAGIGAPAGLHGTELPLGGPGALLAALGQARTGHMADIVGTIQREQDEIIRSPLGGVLMVQGGPGTGKTAVALHRAAYLLYSHRFPLERQGVLVVGPNPLFLRYIERVLPSLGESGVTLSTVPALVHEIRVRGSDRAAVARLKGEARMAKLIARAVRGRERPLRRELVAPWGVTTLRLSGAESEEVVALARRRPGTHNARRRFVERQVVGRLVEQYDRARRRAVVPSTEAAVPLQTHVEEVALGDGDAPASDATPDLDEVARQVRRLPAVVEALDRMWPRLSPHELVHDLFGAKALLAAAGRGLLRDEELGSLYRPRSGSLEEVAWTAADAALVDEARELLGPRRRRSSRRRSETPDRQEAVRFETGFWPSGLSTSPLPAVDGSGIDGEEEVRAYGHIVVDEAQDLSPMQLRMLARRSISGSMTVVGDIAQATGPWAPSGWREVAAHLAPRRAPRIVELTVGYRTPAEVVEVAAGVLAEAAPGLSPPRPVRRSGVPPRAVVVDRGSLAARAAEVAAEEMAAVGNGSPSGGGKVAVLASGARAPELSAALTERGLDPVDPRDPAGPGLAAPLVVLPAGESHGLEFDSVVVVEPAEIAAETGTAGGSDGDTGGGSGGDTGGGSDAPAGVATTRGLRTVYVALTRPTQRLSVVHSLPFPAGLRIG